MYLPILPLVYNVQYSSRTTTYQALMAGHFRVGCQKKNGGIKGRVGRESFLGERKEKISLRNIGVRAEGNICTYQLFFYKIQFRTRFSWLRIFFLLLLLERISNRPILQSFYYYLFTYLVCLLRFVFTGRTVLGPLLRDESANGNLTDGDDELLESLVKTATKSPATRTTPRERKRTRHADRKSCKCAPFAPHQTTPHYALLIPKLHPPHNHDAPTFYLKSINRDPDLISNF